MITATNPCCDLMRRQLEHQCDTCTTDGCPDQVVIYDPTGEYGLPIRDGGGSMYVIEFCPWCGRLLPLEP